MRSRRPSLVIWVGWCLAALSLSTLSAAARAQQPGPAGRPAGPVNPRGAMRERQEREAQLRSAGMVRAPTSPANAEAVLGQVKEDFERIQVVRNEIVRRLKAEGPLDYESIAGEAAEIHKRATRLKAHLLPGAPEGAKSDGKAEIEFTGEQMKSVLVMLCRRIESFVENPIFTTPGVVDVQQSAKANGDLQKILQLSAGIARSAGRLSGGPPR